MTPILRGQPALKPSNPLPDQNQHSQPNPSTHGDLIDFGQSDAAHAAAEPPAPKNHVVPRALSEAPKLQQPLDSTNLHPLTRQDTETNEVDEFVDAHP